MKIGCRRCVAGAHACSLIRRLVRVSWPVVNRFHDRVSRRGRNRGLRVRRRLGDLLLPLPLRRPVPDNQGTSTVLPFCLSMIQTWRSQLLKLVRDSFVNVGHQSPHQSGRRGLMCVTNLQEELIAGEEVATCPSCSLIVKVIYNPVRLWLLRVIFLRFNIHVHSPVHGFFFFFLR